MKEYNVVQLMAQEQIILAFKRYGIEGTEQKLKELYNTMPTLKATLLREYYKLINKE